jgi:hypothetical protein
MTHLTATIAAISAESVRAIDRTASINGVGRLALQAAESIFYSPVANFLELPRVTFHYSVIGAHSLNTLAPGLFDRHISYDVSAAPNTRGDAAGVRARTGCK